MNMDWRTYLAQMAFALAVVGALLLILAVSGCAWVGESRSDGTKLQKEVTVTKRQVLVPATETVPEHVVNLSETVERRLDETVETRTEDHNAPDLPAAEKVISSTAQGFGTGGPVGGAIGLLLGGLAAWRAAQPTVKALKDQMEYHRKDADEAWQKADERALKLPPNQA